MSESSTIVLTNDDGVDAPGLAALRVASDGLINLRIFAPLQPHSGCGHVVTTDRPIAFFDRGEGIVAVDGTPADCVRVAKHFLGSEIDWVISGINAGGNLGADLHHSGTVAAVREAAILGIKGVAISHYIARGRQVDWDQASRWASFVLGALRARPPEPGTFWNVNLPHPEPGSADPSIVRCPVDPSPLPSTFRQDSAGLVYSGDYQKRPRIAGSDIDVCFGGNISLSKVKVICSVDIADDN